MYTDEILRKVVLELAIKSLDGKYSPINVEELANDNIAIAEIFLNYIKNGVDAEKIVD